MSLKVKRIYDLGKFWNLDEYSHFSLLYKSCKYQLVQILSKFKHKYLKIKFAMTSMRPYVSRVAKLKLDEKVKNYSRFNILAVNFFSMIYGLLIQNYLPKNTLSLLQSFNNFLFNNSIFVFLFFCICQSEVLKLKTSKSNVNFVLWTQTFWNKNGLYKNFRSKVIMGSVSDSQREKNQ